MFHPLRIATLKIGSCSFLSQLQSLALSETVLLSLSDSIAEIKKSHWDSGPQNTEDGVWQSLNVLVRYSVEQRENDKKEHCHMVQQPFVI